MFQKLKSLEQFKKLCRFDRVRLGYFDKLSTNVALSVYLTIIHFTSLDPSQLPLAIAISVYFLMNLVKEEFFEKDSQELEQLKTHTISKKR